MKDYISIIIYLSAMVYFYIGTTILSLNKNSILNRAFFGLSLAAVYWSFTFSVANSASTYDMALLWRRFSSLGWGFFFSLLLDLTLILTSKAFLFKNKWLYVLIYFPALLNVWVFGIYDPIVIKQYNLIEGTYGWFHMTENTLWEQYFRVYYSVFLMASLFLFLQWGYKQKTKKKKKSGYYIAGGILLGFLFGSMTNYTLNYLFDLAIPQLEPIFIVVPMLFLFFSVEEFGLRTKSITQEYVKGKFLTKETHEKLLEIISRIYILTAFLVFAFRLFADHWSPARIIPSTLFLFTIGAVLLVLMSLDHLTNRVDRILKLVLLISIPMISVITFDVVGIYGLAGPAVMMLLSVTYNDRRLMKNIIVMTVVIYLCIWLLQPEVVIHFTFVDHIGRLVIFAMIGWIAMFMNRVYTQRLSQVEKQIDIETFRRNITQMLADIEIDNLRERLNSVLFLFTDFYQLQGVTLLLRQDIEIKEYSAIELNRSNPDFEKLIAEMKLLLGNDTLPLDINQLNTRRAINNSDAPPLPVELHWIRNKATVIGVIVMLPSKTKEAKESSQVNVLEYFLDRLTASILKINAEIKIHQMINVDETTGMNTRYALDEFMKELIDKKTDFSFVLINVDNLHVFNEAQGYQQGNVLMRRISEAIMQAIERECFCGRFYSSMFGIAVLHCTDENTMLLMMERTVSYVLHELHSLHFPVEVELSIGISCHINSEEEQSFEIIQHEADLALMSGTENGQRICVYNQKIKESFYDLLQLENDLKYAITENQLVLYYQPKVNIMTNRIIGVEALIRWIHPVRGLIPPNVFLPLAEKLGLIGEIDLWVLQQACRQNYLWTNHGIAIGTVAINVTPITLMDEAMVERIFEFVDQSKCDKRSFEIEITETTAFYLKGKVLKVIDRFRGKGICIALDDFGIDYSSLSRLHFLPVDHIKIDKSFIDDAVADKRSEKVLKNIISLGTDLELALTAEGVETEEQVRLLKNLGCYQVQGFYYYKPMLAEDIEKVMRAL